MTIPFTQFDVMRLYSKCSNTQYEIRVSGRDIDEMQVSGMLRRVE